MLQVAAVLVIFYVLAIIYDLCKTEKRWNDIQQDSEEEK